MSNSMDTTPCAIRIISPESANDLADSVMAGDEDAYKWAKAINGWLKRARSGKSWWCLGCDTAFDGFSEIGVFVVVMPTKKYDHGRENTHSRAGVICAQCVESGKDLKQATLESLHAVENEIN